MITKSRKQKKWRIKEDTVFQIVFLGLILFLIGSLAVSILRVRQRKAELTEKIDSLKEEIRLMEEEKEGLEAGISQTEKESYWEERVREQGYVKEGENQVVVLGPEGEETEGSEANQAFLGGLWEKIKSLFAKITGR